MKKWALTLGVTQVLLAASTMTMAYHIAGVPTALGTSAKVWDNSAGTGLATLLCESDGPADPVNPAPESHGGFGGLCYADSGYATPGGFPPVAADEPADGTTGQTWGKIVPTGGVGGFFIRVGSNAHSCTGSFGGAGLGAFHYRELLAFWVSNGHVTLFVDEPVTTGSYVAAANLGNPGAGYCNGFQTVALAGDGVCNQGPITFNLPVGQGGQSGGVDSDCNNADVQLDQGHIYLRFVDSLGALVKDFTLTQSGPVTGFSGSEAVQLSCPGASPAACKGKVHNFT